MASLQKSKKETLADMGSRRIVTNDAEIGGISVMDKKYEILAQHDFGNTPKDGLLTVYQRQLDDGELLVSIIQDLLKFPAPLTISIVKMRDLEESP